MAFPNGFISILFIVGFQLIANIGLGQSVDSIYSVKSSKLGLAANILYHKTDAEGIEFDTLIGDVTINQDSLFLFCDRAYVRNRNFVEAVGEVSIVQNDSIQLFADSLIYDDESGIAFLHKKVIIRNNDKQLFTEFAKYDVNTKKAYYTKGATLKNQGTTLLSKTGVYEIENDLAFFRDRVTIKDSSSVLRTDSINYNLNTETIYVIAPTNLSTDSTEIYFEGGNYNYRSGKGYFYKNLQIKTNERLILADLMHYDSKEKKYTLLGYPVIKNDDSFASADTIIFLSVNDEIRLVGKAYYKDIDQELRSNKIVYNLNDEQFETFGDASVADKDGRILSADRIFSNTDGRKYAEQNVLLRDTAQSIILYGDLLEMQSKNESFRLYNSLDQPLFVQIFEQDSLLLKADTLNYLNSDSEGDSISYYTGKNNVHFVKGEISGRSNELQFSEVDSLFKLSGNPIVWSDSSQMTGDTIIVQLENGKIESMEILNNAFMIIQNAHGTFDQVKGDRILNIFSDNQLQYSIVNGNVEMLYLMYEDERLKGINHSFCGSLKFKFQNENIDTITFLDKPNSTFSRGEIDNVETYYIQGFVWDQEKKPHISFISAK